MYPGHLLQDQQGNAEVCWVMICAEQGRGGEIWKNDLESVTERVKINCTSADVFLTHMKNVSV